MEFNHLSFYVEAVAPWRDWFVNAWGGVCSEPAAEASAEQNSRQALVYVGRVPLLIVADAAVVGTY
ncbi:hypothetical protein C8B47_03770, partial [filamentous cyanobacterium CCP4]